MWGIRSDILAKLRRILHVFRERCIIPNSYVLGTIPQVVADCRFSIVGRRGRVVPYPLTSLPHLSSLGFLRVDSVNNDSKDIFFRVTAQGQHDVLAHSRGMLLQQGHLITRSLEHVNGIVRTWIIALERRMKTTACWKNLRRYWRRS